jgi:hypothetical protein
MLSWERSGDPVAGPKFVPRTVNDAGEDVENGVCKTDRMRGLAYDTACTNDRQRAVR